MSSRLCWVDNFRRVFTYLPRHILELVMYAAQMVFVLGTMPLIFVVSGVAWLFGGEFKKIFAYGVTVSCFLTNVVIVPVTLAEIVIEATFGLLGIIVGVASLVFFAPFDIWSFYDIAVVDIDVHYFAPRSLGDELAKIRRNYPSYQDESSPSSAFIHGIRDSVPVHSTPIVLSPILNNVLPFQVEHPLVNNKKLDMTGSDTFFERYKNFWDFDPNNARCALTGVLLGIDDCSSAEDIEKNAVVKADDGKYYLKSALDGALNEVRKSGDDALSSVYPDYSKHNVLDECLLVKFVENKTECPILLTKIIPEQAVRDLYGNYYDKRSIEGWLTTRKEIAPLNMQPLTKEYLRSVSFQENNETISEQNNFRHNI